MIYHVHSFYQPKHPDTQRRMRLAMRTWNEQPWVDLPIPESEGRTFHDHAGHVPYIKDLFNRACSSKDKQDIIVFTNSDICVSSNCACVVAACLQVVDGIYCFRRDFWHLNTPIPDGIIKTGMHYVGTDFYAFRVSWWKKYRDNYPDMLLGREAWDAVMRILMDMTHPGQRCTVENLIYHEKHASAWENPANRRRLPSQLHNVNLAKSWLISVGFNPRSIGI